MAELNIFRYIPGNSHIHRLDSRIKLISLILFAIMTSLATGLYELSLINISLVGILFLTHLPLKILITEIRNFFIFVLFIIITQAYSIQGSPLFSGSLPSPTYEGLFSGLIFGWKLILIIINGLIITGTTPLSLFRQAIEWFLRPIPFVPEARIGTMFSLTFAMLPLIFDQANEISEAQHSRCVERCKNPIRRITLQIYPLILRTILRADEIAAAMESRCYSEVRTKPSFKTTLSDWLFLIFITTLLTYIILNA